MIYFAECLGCCHNIEKFEDKNLGDAIDIKMFESVNWMIQYEEDKESQKKRRYIMPSNIFKITEKSFFKNLSKNLDDNKKNRNFSLASLPQYKILIEKIYPFSSENQTTTVITKNILDKSRRIYIKGAPEKILEKCTKLSKPDNINSLIMDLTKKGLRVIACATRLLDGREGEEHAQSSHDGKRQAVGISSRCRTLCLDALHGGRRDNGNRASCIRYSFLPWHYGSRISDLCGYRCVHRSLCIKPDVCDIALCACHDGLLFFAHARYVQ